MEILVCVKRVPNTGQTSVESDGTLSSAGAQYILNPYDEYAVEQALQIKDKVGGKVTVLSMGVPEAETVIRDAIAFGADAGILVSDPEFENLDTHHTALVLAKAIQKFGQANLVICGNKAIDADTWQVAPQLAHHLNWPQILFVRKVEETSDASIKAERLTDDGFDRVQGKLPLLISVVKEIGEPRLASLKGKMNAKKAEIQKWDKAALEIGDEVSKGKSFVAYPKYSKLEKKTEGRVFTGEAAQIVDEFLKAAEEDKLF